RVSGHGAQIREARLGLVPLNWRRRSLNPIAGIAALCRLVRLYRHERPDLVHHVALKPVILGSMAAALCGRPRTVNALAGLGFVFASESPRARVLRPAVRWLLGILLGRGGAHVIVQNPDDRDFLAAHHMAAPERIHLIRGAGVDLQEFQPRPEPRSEPGGAVTAILVSRMLWDKGVGVLVEAARILERRTPKRNRRLGPMGEDRSGRKRSASPGSGQDGGQAQQHQQQHRRFGNDSDRGNARGHMEGVRIER
ncbi:MAG: hypothetical protein IID39_05875, partial [Planctomycetes bacterium]|nr:hypothetical protein [Planctomycetota bacterium]